MRWSSLRWGLLLLVGVLLHWPFLRQAPRALTPAERALAAVARQALLTGDRSFDYGRFFLLAEGASGGSLERQWRLVAAQLKEKAGSVGEQHLDLGVSSMMLVLFQRAHLGRYKREEARMSGFFSEHEPGGNCEAQTKLLISSLQEARMKLPEGKIVGVEVFQDHVQAVIVDRRRRLLWNLLTGEMDAAPRSDVYLPAVLLAAYLRGLGQRPPVPESDLLLLRGPRPTALRRGWAFFTTSTMKLPAAANRFAQGEPPTRAEVPLPVPRQPGDASTPTGGAKLAVSREEFLRDGDEDQLFSMTEIDAPFVLLGATVVFRDEAAAARYLAARTEADRRALLLALTEEQFRAEIADGVPVLPPLEELAHRNEGALNERLRRIRRIEKLSLLADSAIRRGRSSAMVPEELELRLPELQTVQASVRAFNEEAARDPGAFFRRFSALDGGRRRALLAFCLPRLQSAQVKALATALADPKRVALAAGEHQPAPAPTRPMIFEDVELIDVPLPPPAAASAAPTATGSGPPGGAPEPPPQTEPLSVGAYLDLVLSGLFSSGAASEALPVLDRWTPAVSEHLLRTPPGSRCAEVQIQFPDVVLRVLKEAGREPPAHMAEVARRLERGCKK